LDGSTGQVRWQRRLWVGNTQLPFMDRFIPGPDLDGDGCRELFAAWVGYDTGLQKSFLHVAALSGADGRTLWRWRQEVSGNRTTPDSSGPLRWWQVGADGWPQLLVPLANGPGGQHMTFVLSAGTGQLVHILPEV